MSTVVKITRGNVRTSLPVLSMAEGRRRVAQIEAEHERKIRDRIAGLSPENVIDHCVLVASLPSRPITKVLDIPVSR